MAFMLDWVPLVGSSQQQWALSLTLTLLVDEPPQD